jgi:hypothetical protein
MAKMTDEQSVQFAFDKMTNGGQPIMKGIKWLRYRGYGGNVGAYINKFVPLKNERMQLMVMDAAKQYTKLLYDDGVEIDAGEVLRGWGLDYLTPVYLSIHGDLQPVDDTILGKFKIAMRVWALKVKTLNESTPATADLKARKLTLLKRAKYIKKTIETILPKFEMNTGELNAAPIVFVVSGAVVTSIYLLTKAWNKQNDTWQAENLQSHERFIANPQAAIALEKEKSKSSIMGGLSSTTRNIAIVVAIGGAIYFYNQYSNKRGF